MRILYHHRIASKDGQYVHLEELVAAFKRAGHEVILVGPNIVDSAEFGSEGGLINSLRNALPAMFYELLEFAYSFFAYVRLRRAAKRSKPDFIYERYNLFFPAGVWVGRHLGIPLILEVNAPLYEERARYNGISLKRLALWSQNYVWCNADAVLPVTAILASMVASAGVKEGNISVIHNGVVLQRFDNLSLRTAAKARLGIPEGIAFGFVGFIREWHRLDTVITAMAESELSRSTLVVIGDGPARDQLESQARQLAVSDRVIFTGLVQRSDLLEIMAAFDVALQPHVVAYASPLKLFEYMAMSLPIIAPDTPNINEVLTNAEDALLVSPGDQAAMKSALVRLANDEQLRMKLGKGARARLESGGFTWDGNANRVVQIARELVG